MAALGTVPDPRGRRGRRHPLGAMLSQAVAALLSGARSLAGIAEWGRLQEASVVHRLGYQRDQTPALSTLHAALGRVDAAAVEAALAGWAQARLGPGDTVIAVDGKALRGTYGERTPGLAVLAAYTHEAGRVLAQTGGPGRAS